MAKKTQSEGDQAPEKKRSRKAADTAEKEKAPARKSSASKDTARSSDGAASAKGAKKAASGGRKRASKSDPSREDIQRRAYELYEARGGKHGLHDDDWLEAERQLRGEGKSK